MIFKYFKVVNEIVKSVFKIVKSKSSYRRSNIWSEQTNTKDLKTQCCYKKEISYEAYEAGSSRSLIEMMCRYINFQIFD